MTVLPEINSAQQIDTQSQNVSVNPGGETSTDRTEFDSVLNESMVKMNNEPVQLDKDPQNNLITELLYPVIAMPGNAATTDFNRASCESIEEIASAVIPAKAGIQKSLVLKNTGFPIKTSGMTNKDFCKSLNNKQAAGTNDNQISPLGKEEIERFSGEKFSNTANITLTENFQKDSQPIALSANSDFNALSDIMDLIKVLSDDEPFISHLLTQEYGHNRVALSQMSHKLESTRTEMPDLFSGQTVSKQPELKLSDINGQKSALSPDDISGKNPELRVSESFDTMPFINGKKSVPSPDILSVKNTVLKISNLPAIIYVKGQKPILFSENIFSRQSELRIVEGIDFSNKKGFESITDHPFKVNGVNLLSSTNIAYGNNKTGDNSFSEIAAKPSGFNDLLEKVVYVAKAGNRLEVSIEHGNLGKLNIDLSVEKGALNVHINASDKAVRELIENNIQHIVDSLAKEGVSISGFSVSLKDGSDNAAAAFAGDTYAKEITKIPEAHETAGLVSIFI